MKELIAAGGHHRRFVEDHTAGFEELRSGLEALDWKDLEAGSGLPRSEMKALAEMVGEAERAVFVWSMGVTQHSNGEDNVRAIVNLALARGFVGREGCGLMPIRGHSGVQGGAEMGCYATAFPGGLGVDAENAARLGGVWGFDPPVEPGMTAPQMIEAAGRGELDVLVASGGNFLDVLPEPREVERRLASIPLRVHIDIVASAQMLVDPGEEVLLLPAATRYETPGGLTETTTERRVVLSPEIEGPRIGEARPEWEVLLELARRARPELAADPVAGPGLDPAGTGALRAEIAQAVPSYAPIADLTEGGESFQYGGACLCEGWVFPTADGRARFTVVDPPPVVPPDGRFAVSTRRGKQFNSMVQERRDSLTGALREAVLISAADAERLGVVEGDEVELRSEHGSLRGRAHLAPIAPGNLQVHWPEGNVLIGGGERSPQAGIPDYNARVSVERI
jgi:molybdopterin-dependent oxidoreductase alpha subunit